MDLPHRNLEMISWPGWIQFLNPGMPWMPEQDRRNLQNL